ncbi:MAG TPA: YegP family protein [Actinomycetota bacterium]|nr:YegP family protein [Actinomycetota bacterium]
MAAKFSIRTSKNDQFHFVLVAGNGEAVANSEMYASKSGAVKGAEACQRAAAAATIVDDTGA